MHKEHPMPNTPATKAPKVDGFVTDYLKAAFPKSNNGELIKVQSALLKVCGPMACMWAELIDNNLLSDADATVNVHDALNIIQYTIVLLGNANEMLYQLRRSKILAAVDTSLIKYGQKPQPESEEFLFGSEFTKYLRGEVETDSSLAEVVSLSRCHYPYNNACQATIGRTKNQFFEGVLPGSGGLGRAVIRPHQTTNHISHQEAIHPTDQGGKANLTQPNQRDFKSVTTTKGIVTFVGPGYNADGKACMHTSWWQTVPICSQLVLSDKGPMGIRVSSRLPATLESLASTQHGATHAVKRGPVTSLKGRGEKFNRKRSCGACQRESNTSNQPSFCGTQKLRRKASNNRPEKIKSVPQATPFQNGGVTHATKCSTPELLHGQGGSERRLSNSSSVSRVPLSLRLSR